jgi:serine/threonine protein kinase
LKTKDSETRCSLVTGVKVMSNPLADRNLLFGVLALHADLIDSEQFVEVCSAWAGHKEVTLADLLLARGWITDGDRAAVEHLVGLKLRRHGGDGYSSLAAILDNLTRCALSRVGDPEIQRSLADLPLFTTAAASTVTFRTGDRGRYSLKQLHAIGGIGQVWLAHDSDLDRDVALKELRPEQVNHPTALRRFLDEARITGQLDHPGAVPVYELIQRTPEHSPFYTMRFIKGQTLAEAARAYHRKRSESQADPLEFVTLLNAFVAVCNTVAYAHSRGIVHRDLKGQNIILGDFGEVVLLDWGLAKVLGQSEGETDPLLDPQAAINDSGRTVGGQVIGTPGYMAPEQAAGRPDLVDFRSDVYGLGAILYELLTGRPPFEGPDLPEVLRMVREDDPLPPRRLNREVSPALESASLRALAKDPARRHASASHLAAEVQYWQDLQRRRAEEALKRANEELTSSNAQLQKLAADLELKIVSELRAHQELMEAKQRQLTQAEELAKLGRMSATFADEIDGINASLSKYFFVLHEWMTSLWDRFQRYQDEEPAAAGSHHEPRRHDHDIGEQTRRPPGKAEMEELLTMSRNGILRIRQIVKNFRDFARRAGGHSRGPDLNAAIEPTIEIFRSRGAERGVILEADLAPTLPPLLCPPSEANQIVFHLLGNAIDACSEGDRVTIRTNSAEGAVEVHVVDTGCGISPDLIDKIFEPFFTTKAPGLGDGIGLSRSRLIAEEHGGRIWVESAPGGPTHFTLRFPAISERERAPDREPAE